MEANIANDSMTVKITPNDMSEWLKEHAWKAIQSSITKRHRNTSLRNRFNNLPLQDAR